MRRSSAMLLLASFAALLASGSALAGPYDDAQDALTRHDYAGAVRLFRQAADADNPAAQYNLGRLYVEGLGVPQDYKSAASWFREAADQGHPGAEFNLGLLYQEGHGFRRDGTQAAAWYRKAASQGYVDAQTRLAAMYAKGDGVAEDPAAAAKWYREAASHGDAGARLDLALIIAEGPIAPSSSLGMDQTNFKQDMNHVFGQGRWRETGGFRSRARENQLRAEGALTVAPGDISRHSLGTPDAPGAYDIVVEGLSPEQAALKIRKSGIAFQRLFPEGLHGTQGAHLHVEPFLAQLREAIWRRTLPDQRSAAPLSDAARTPDARRDAEEALSLLRSAAARGDTCALRALSGKATSGEATARAYLALQKTGACG
ncbi:MAG: tetratricopeptide repeat protein [Caulobacteraceae bacterium]